MSTLYVREAQSFIEASPERVLERAKELIAASFHTDGLMVRDPAVLQAFLMAQLRGELRVVSSLLFLDAHDRLLQYVEFCSAGLHRALKHPRELLRSALARDAAKALLVRYCPPGGEPLAREDREACNTLRALLALIEIRLKTCLLADGQLMVEGDNR